VVVISWDPFPQRIFFRYLIFTGTSAFGMGESIKLKRCEDRMLEPLNEGHEKSLIVQTAY
jgi:hypothetical protein